MLSLLKSAAIISVAVGMSKRYREYPGAKMYVNTTIATVMRRDLLRRAGQIPGRTHVTHVSEGEGGTLSLAVLDGLPYFLRSERGVYVADTQAG